MKIEQRNLDQSRSGVEIRKSEDDESRTISGLGAVFYDGTDETEFRLAKDYVERIDPNAFDEALKEDDVRGVFNHDPNMILGRNKAGTMKLEVTERGLQYTIDVPETTVGNDVATSIERGDITGSSFKFRATGEEYSEDGDLLIRTITKAKLFDIGPVTFPAYEGTTAEARSDAAEARKAYFDAKADREAQKASELKAKLSQVQARARVAEIS